MSILALNTAGIYNLLLALITKYGYEAIFGLMVLESATVPVPSEVVLPIAGLLAAKGLMNIYLALIAATAGSILGMLVDYVIGYYIGKEVIYKHLGLFHFSKKSLDDFDRWFNNNAAASVFLSRMLPVVRTIVSFPAGFSKMNIKEFVAYSLAGAVIWDAVLISYGYYLLSSKSAEVVLGSIGVLAIVIYALYKVTTKRLHKRGK
jgi:membrane protein DedA with SNARE-associated domain